MRTFEEQLKLNASLRKKFQHHKISAKNAAKNCEQQEKELLDIYLSYFSQPDMDSETLLFYLEEIRNFKVLNFQEASWWIAFSLQKNIALPLLLLENPSFTDIIFQQEGQ